MSLAGPRSAYLHIPFCYQRCFYCDFVVVPLGNYPKIENNKNSSLIKSYLDILRREIAASPKGPPLSTVYIGGGTPSLLSPLEISLLLDDLRNHFGIQEGAEVSLEIDPASFDKDDLLGFIEAGITRVSLGAQSFSDSILKQLGRKHSRKELMESCNWIDDCYKQGRLFSWSLDLIQSLPGQDLVSWQDQLDQAIKTSSPHLSVYELSIEPGTVFAWQKSKGQLKLPDEDLSAEILRLTSSSLKSAGFSRYEVSNYSLPGHCSRHNRVYWSGSGWWGFGQGATSSPWGKRFTRPKSAKEYQIWVDKQQEEYSDSSLLPSNSIPVELDDQILVGLRRREGVDMNCLALNYGWSQKEFEEYFSLLLVRWDVAINSGWLVCNGTRCFLTDPEGMDFSNQVLIQMLLWWDSLPCNSDLRPNLEELE